MLFSAILFHGSLFIESETLQAPERQINSVETIKTTLKENQLFDTFVEEDVFYF